MAPVIAVKQLTFSYPGSSHQALKNLNFEVAAGEFIGITGPAGAGKSTLVFCLNGIVPHFQAGSFQGAVLINGQDTFESGCAAISRQVGSVFQDPEAQIIAPTVEDEIAFGLENFGLEPTEIASRIGEALELIGIADLQQRSTQELSGGQKQRVAIAAVVALRPGILILDEPTSELDPIGTLEVFEVLKTLNEVHGLTIIVVEQKLNILMEYIKRLIILRDGEQVCDAPPRQIISQNLLKSIGLNAPPISELALRLKADGLYNAEIPLTVDEAYWGLLKILKQTGDKND